VRRGAEFVPLKEAAAANGAAAALTARKVG
jgi:hypothetical protein